MPVMFASRNEVTCTQQSTGRWIWGSTRASARSRTLWWILGRRVNRVVASTYRIVMCAATDAVSASGQDHSHLTVSVRCPHLPPPTDTLGALLSVRRIPTPPGRRRSPLSSHGPVHGGCRAPFRSCDPLPDGPYHFCPAADPGPQGRMRCDPALGQLHALRVAERRRRPNPRWRDPTRVPCGALTVLNIALFAARCSCRDDLADSAAPARPPRASPDDGGRFRRLRFPRNECSWFLIGTLLSCLTELTQYTGPAPPSCPARTASSTRRRHHEYAAPTRCACCSWRNRAHGRVVVHSDNVARSTM